MNTRPHDGIATLTLPNEELLPFLIGELEQTPGKTVTLPLRGNSMRPFLKDGRDKALLTLPTNPQVGDAVLARIGHSRYVLHRIVDIDGQRVTLRGDGNIATEQCRLADVKATAIGFYRHGSRRLDSTAGLKWRCYSWLWTRMLPLRRYLLFALNPHIPRRFKREATTI